MISHSISFCNLLRPSTAFDRVRSSRAFWQAPNGLSDTLARTFHLVEAATRMQLASMGKVAYSVPFTKGKTKMTLYKGDAALETRRAVASKLTHSLIGAQLGLSSARRGRWRAVMSEGVSALATARRVASASGPL